MTCRSLIRHVQWSYLSSKWLVDWLFASYSDCTYHQNDLWIPDSSHITIVSHVSSKWCEDSWFITYIDRTYYQNDLFVDDSLFTTNVHIIKMTCRWLIHHKQRLYIPSKLLVDGWFIVYNERTYHQNVHIIKMTCRLLIRHVQRSSNSW